MHAKKRKYQEGRSQALPKTWHSSCELFKLQDDLSLMHCHLTPGIPTLSSPGSAPSAFHCSPDTEHLQPGVVHRWLCSLHSQCHFCCSTRLCPDSMNNSRVLVTSICLGPRLSTLLLGIWMGATIGPQLSNSMHHKNQNQVDVAPDLQCCL